MRFPTTAEFTGANAPVRIEADVRGLATISGEVPRQLNGTFYRIQPDPAWPPRLGTDISLNGDGMLTAFIFENGHVDFRSRYIKTEKFLAERESRKALFGAYRNPFTDDPSVAGLSRGTANTAILWHGKLLFALKEDSRPVEIDPITLETIDRRYDYGGTLTSLTLSAHPKIDPLSGELVTYGYAARGETTRDIAWYVIDADGHIVRERWIEAPYGCMIHDFGVTAKHLLFPITPLCSDIERLRAGGPHFAWDGSLPSYLGIVPRDGTGAPRWIEGPTCHSTHTMNAFEEDGLIHYDTPTSEITVFPFFPSTDGTAWDAAKGAPLLKRWTVDPTAPAEGIRHRSLTHISGDFPRIDDRFAMRCHRIGWIVGTDPDNGPRAGRRPPDAIAQHDFDSGACTLYRTGSDSAAQEPVFIPRHATAGEGDGWLILVVHRLAELRSDLVILDTADIASGPVAEIALPFRLRRGLHGTWVSGDLLASR